VTSPSREILVLDVATENVVYRLTGHAMSTGERPPALAFSPDGKRLASARSGASAGIGPSGKSELILWDMTSGEEVMRLLGSPLALSNPALPTFSSDGHRIEMGAAPARIFDATPRAVSPK
jgi:WD40 repeat protein